jgi:hypothetical protein
MNRVVLFLLVVCVLLMSACSEERVTNPAPASVPDISGVLAGVANVPLRLISFTPPRGAAKLTGTSNFYVRIFEEYLFGNDGCYDFVQTFRVTGDVIRISLWKTTENGCGAPPIPRASDLEGVWRVTTSADRIVLKGDRGRFEFTTEYSASVKDLPLVGKLWLLSGSDDDLFDQLRAANALPLLQMTQSRWVTLRWDARCAGYPIEFEVFNATFGVNQDSGIVMKYIAHDGCSYGTSPADAAVWSFASTFFESSIYAVTDSGAVFRNTRLHKYYRFVAAP